jgi:hypothetical protein
MDLFDILIWAEILVKTAFLGTPTFIVPCMNLSLKERWFLKTYRMVKEMLRLYDG